MSTKSKKIIILSVASILVLFSTYMIFLNKNTIKNAENKKDEENLYEISKKKDNAKKIDIYINKSEINLNGEKIPRWVYTDKDNNEYGAGMPIIANLGDTLDIKVHNNSTEKTNIHWHGLSVDNSQDGPGILIEPNKTHDYKIKMEQTGTYWYHSHERPVRDQVDNGMYAPLIVKDKDDDNYDKDYILTLDDWINKEGNIGGMEGVGAVDTVNGRTADDILPIEITNGQVNKLRLIGSSTALTHNMEFPVPVKVTHTDGKKLTKFYETTNLSISPGERYDVELQVESNKSERLFINNDRNLGMSIPIEYTHTKGGKAAQSQLKKTNNTGIFAKSSSKPEIEMILSDNMNGMSTGHRWTINDEVFPEGEKFTFEKNKVYTIRFKNEGMHAMDHPMHIHGAHFAVKSVNGTVQKNEVWKDTINIPYGEYIDVVMKFDKVGEWMVHCHILDHEDGGMMTSIVVK